jgi:hypothetical protein
VQVWALVKRYIELASEHEVVVESAVKIIMCAPEACVPMPLCRRCCRALGRLQL